MGRCLPAVVLALALGAWAACAERQGPEPAPPRADIVLTPDTETISGEVPRDATLDTLFRANGAREDLIVPLVEIARTVFDPRKLRAGQPFRMVRTTDGAIRSFEYEIDVDRFLRIAPRDGGFDTELAAEIVAYRKERGIVSLRGAIDREATSLFAAMEREGEGPDLSIALADVFAGDIDFNVDLQPGDTFSVAVEKIFREEGFAGYGPIVAAEFVNEGRVLCAIRFAPPGGKPGYYDEKGRSLKRFFLRSPLKFTPTVSSRFSNRRLHPILRIYRPHLGVDYRAPLGSPVIAAASGVVIAAGMNGASGRMVHLRHPNGYETYYLHLSRVEPGIRTGARVEQGQLLGRVGSSGLSTGPHLDYRIRRGGAFVNPILEHKRLPPGEPLLASSLPLFEVERNRALARLVPR